MILFPPSIRRKGSDVSTILVSPAALPCFFAQGGDGVDVTPKELRNSSSDHFIILVALLGVTFVLLLLAVIFRNRLRKLKSRRRYHSTESDPDEPSERRHHRKHRRRHSSHQEFPKNPTLAETGGLPPRREEPDELPPAGQQLL
jgi:hypothetical protein